MCGKPFSVVWRKCKLYCRVNTKLNVNGILERSAINIIVLHTFKWIVSNDCCQQDFRATSYYTDKCLIIKYNARKSGKISALSFSNKSYAKYILYH